MATSTINISLPTGLYKDAKSLQKKRGYASISELIREALRNIVYPNITVNGFTREFEDEVLKSAKEPISKAKILKTDRDVTEYFEKLSQP